MSDRVPAEGFPPGEFLKDELQERNWTQEEFATIIGRPAAVVNQIISGKRGISPETAAEIGAALGTSAMYWLNLDSAYRLWRAGPAPTRIVKEAKIRSLFPVREMIKRGWVQASESPEVLEQNVLQFFGINSLDETPTLAHAARKTGYPDDISGTQRAWLFRVKQIASAMVVPEYSERKFHEVVAQLKNLREDPENIRQVPHLLSQAGIRFVIVEHVPSSKIDGVCFWIKDTDWSPVLGLSLRLDRIDNFWFVLRHECEHILQEHGREEAIVDRDVTASGPSDTIPHEEVVANAAAAEFCVPKAEMEDFIIRHHPLYSEDKVVKFARRMQVHPGLVVGQLQHRLQDFRLFKKYQISVRSLIAPYSVADGYGQVVPHSL